MEILVAEAPEAAGVRLQVEMDRFGKDKNQSIKITQVGWDNIWRELINVSIYHRGPDIAEIGSSWLDGFVAMQSLNPISARDIHQIGGQETFLPALWKNVGLNNQNEVWGIPFRADANVIFYWKDQLAQANVDPAEAFLTAENITAAFTKLQEADIPAWIAPTNNTHNTIHSIASWIWGAGGDFLTPNHKKTAITSPNAMRGVQAYFDLLRFMPKQTSPFNDNDALQLFLARKAAVFMTGPGLLTSLKLRKDAEELLPHLGIAMPPGPAFVGGTLLVTWKHSKYLFEPIDLIGRLISQPFQSEYWQVAGLLPVRQDIWTDEFIDSDVYLPTFYRAITTGRSLQPTSLWSIVENQLANTFGGIWRDLYALNLPRQKIPTLNEVIARRFNMLTLGLDLTLSTYNEPYEDNDTGFAD